MRKSMTIESFNINVLVHLEPLSNGMTNNSFTRGIYIYN